MSVRCDNCFKEYATAEEMRADLICGATPAALPAFEVGKRYRGTFECEDHDRGYARFVPIGTPRLVPPKPTQRELWDWAKRNCVEVKCAEKDYVVTVGVTSLRRPTRIAALRAIRRRLESGR